MVRAASGVSPRLQAIGIGASMCATSKWPTAMRSRMLAQEVSRTSVRSTPSRCGEALLLRRDEQGAVEQRHEAGGDLVCGRSSSVVLRGPSSPAAVTRLCAISPILRFWFIAVLRSSA